MNLFKDVGCCGIGSGPDRPYSGVTAVVDFSAHEHKDVNNMIGGTTAIVTLSKPDIRGNKKSVQKLY